MAREYFDRWLPSVDAFTRGAGYAQRDGDLNKAAFDFHQAAERLYICFLLVRTLYFPRSHNIKFLRSLAEDKEPRLVEAWPRASRQDRARFERLKRAYVEARYSPQFTITPEELDWIGERIVALQDLVRAICQEQLAALATSAAIS
jgi:HEPN domain-containing protein